MKQREANYDLLRILACAGVVLVHVSAIFAETFIWDLADGLPGNHPFYTLMYNSVGRFAVPVFLMLTGAFVLGDERTRDYRSFYRNTLKKIGIPYLIVVLAACLYNAWIAYRVEYTGMAGITGPLVNGVPFYHLWYMSVLFIIYLFLPGIERIRVKMSPHGFAVLSVVWLLAGNAWLFLSEPVTMHWNPREALCYTGYVLTGYVIHTSVRKNSRGWLLVLAGIVLELWLGYQVYTGIRHGIDRELLEQRWLLAYTPGITVSSLLIFSGFGMIDLRKDYRKLSAYSYPVFLVHALILDLILRLSRYYLGQRWLAHLDSRIFIPLLTIFILIISRVISPCLMGPKTHK